MNILTDFHHSALLNSLIMLFEDRLGGTLYRPIGMSWYEKGYWHIFDHPATVQQYLAIGGATPDGSPKLNEVAWEQTSHPTVWKPIEGLYHCKDIEGDTTNKAITYECFMDLDIDIVIASIPQHIEPFKRLVELHPNKPKLIYQIGNAWPIEANSVKNVMASAVIHNRPDGINFVSYHQEFDLSTFHPQDAILPDPNKNIYTFVNCFNTQDQFTMDWQLFQEMEQAMPASWDFKSFGGQCRDGNCNGTKEVAAKMREARFIWHTKNNGDGFGHVIHSAAACGKPLIVKKSYYMGKMAEPLLIDGVTCIAIDGLDIQGIINKINFFSDPKRYREMCQNVYDNFKKVVDFDKEEQALRKFLERVV